MMKTGKKLSFQIVVAILAAVLVAQPAFAVPRLDYSAIDNNWYDERGNNVCKDFGGGSPGQSAPMVHLEDNIKTLFFTLLANGFTKQQAAAVLGNIQMESTFNPRAIGPGGKPIGIAQWLITGRWAELLRWKGSKDEWAFDTQVQFIIHEVKEVPQFIAVFKKMQATTSLEQQVLIWANEYEVTDIIGPRVKYAQDFMAKDWYQSAPEGGNGTQAGSSGNGSCSSTGGGGSQYVDGFVVYSQTDPRWKNYPYGTTRIGPSGCGPTAMAMIVTNLTGKSVLPPEAADVAHDSGMFVTSCDCSSWGIGPELAKHYGLSSKPVGTDMGKINEALRAGGLIIMSGSGPVPFTSAGHFIVIRAVTPDGKWMVGDSAHKDANTQKFDPQLILSHGNAGSAYAISK